MLLPSDWEREHKSAESLGAPAVQWAGIRSSDWLVESHEGEAPALNSLHRQPLKKSVDSLTDEMIPLPHVVPLITSVSQQGARQRRMWRIWVNNSGVDWNLKTGREKEREGGRVWFMQRAECEEKLLVGMLQTLFFLVYSFGFWQVIYIYSGYFHNAWRKRHNELFITLFSSFRPYYQVNVVLTRPVTVPLLLGIYPVMQ